MRGPWRSAMITVRRRVCLMAGISADVAESWLVSARAARGQLTETVEPVRRVPPMSSGGAPMTNSHILVGAPTSPAQPAVRRISAADIYYALARGIDDFTAVPSHAVFLCVI